MASTPYVPTYSAPLSAPSAPATVPTTSAPLSERAPAGSQRAPAGSAFAPGGGSALAGLGSETPKRMGRGELGGRKTNVGLAILSVFIPPLAVALRTGDGCETLINFGLFLCGYLPGLVHALLITQTDARCNTCTNALAVEDAPAQAMARALEQGLVQADAPAAPTARPTVSVAAKDAAAAAPSPASDPRAA